MDYDIRVKKPANARTRENSHATVNLARLAYVRGREDMRQASDTRIKQLVRDAAEESLDLNPEYTLGQTEYIIVLPNMRVDTNKRRLQKAIFKGEMELPAETVNEHRRKRKEAGYQ